MGVGFVIADLMKSGMQVATLLSEHLPFDLIVISPKMRLCRLSVKYCTAKAGIVEIAYRSTWSDRHGSHHIYSDHNEFDASAVYCPDTDHVYYVRNDETNNTTGVKLRLVAPRNNQTDGVRMAVNFLGAARLFPTSE